MPARTKKDAAAEDAAMEDAPVSAQVEDVPDQEMPENGAGGDEEEEEEEEVEAQRVKIVSFTSYSSLRASAVSA